MVPLTSATERWSIGGNTRLCSLLALLNYSMALSVACCTVCAMQAAAGDPILSADDVEGTLTASAAGQGFKVDFSDDGWMCPPNTTARHPPVRINFKHMGIDCASRSGASCDWPACPTGLQLLLKEGTKAKPLRVDNMARKPSWFNAVAKGLAWLPVVTLNTISHVSTAGAPNDGLGVQGGCLGQQKPFTNDMVQCERSLSWTDAVSVH
jgi:hypothetical protein